MKTASDLLKRSRAQNRTKKLKDNGRDLDLVVRRRFTFEHALWMIERGRSIEEVDAFVARCR